MRYKTPAAHGMAVKEAAKKSPLDANRAIAGFYLHRLLCRVFSDPDSPFVLKGGQSVLARNLPERFQIPAAWPAVYGKPYAKMARQAKVDDVAPDMVSAEELAAKLYEPALGTHWKHGASTWSPSSLVWAAAEGNDALEPDDNISHSTKTQGR